MSHGVPMLTTGIAVSRPVGREPSRSTPGQTLRTREPREPTRGVLPRCSCRVSLPTQDVSRHTTGSAWLQTSPPRHMRHRFAMITTGIAVSRLVGREPCARRLGKRFRTRELEHTCAARDRSRPT